MESIKDSLSQYALEQYVHARTYHDGKRVLMTIDDEKVIEDVIKILEIKKA